METACRGELREMSDLYSAMCAEAGREVEDKARGAPGGGCSGWWTGS